MIVATLLGWLGSGVLVAASCAAPPLASYQVTLAAEPVTVATSFSLADIEALARQSPSKAGHPPFGFYIGTLAYSISVVHDTSSQQCPLQIAIHVSMAISKRHIEIGHEISSRKCLYSALLDHYRKHADDDISLIEGYRKQVERVLLERPPQLPYGDHATTPEGQAEIARITAESVEIALQGLSEERSAAAERVDTPDELRRLTQACADRA